jgi:hypothetical protein
MNIMTNALIILLVSLIGLEISGMWLIRSSRLSSHPEYKIIGTIVCWGGLLFLIVGIIGFLFAGYF